MTGGTEAAAAAWTAEVLGPERVRVGREETLPWTVGGRMPGVVAFPRSTEEVAALLERAGRSGLGVAPAGAGTWLRGGDPPGEVDLLVSVGEMDRILHYEPMDLTLTAGAGCRLEALERATGTHGQWFPVDPPGAPGGTLGATVATGSDGTLRSRYGGIRDMVLGLTVVTGRGETLRLGGNVVKNVAGFDLCRLMVGSWGTLGILTEVTVRLYPRPEVRRRLSLRSDIDDLLGVALKAGDEIQGAARLVLEDGVREAGERSAVLTVELHGSSPAVEAQVATLKACSDAPWETSARPPASKGGKADLVVRLRLPRTELGRLVGLARGLGRVSTERRADRAAPVRPALTLDALRGTLRVSVPNLRTDGPWSDRWADRIEDLRRTLELRGGGLALEEAPPEVARRVPSRGAPSDVVGELADRIRTAFDPDGVLVPARAPARRARP